MRRRIISRLIAFSFLATCLCCACTRQPPKDEWRIGVDPSQVALGMQTRMTINIHVGSPGLKPGGVVRLEFSPFMKMNFSKPVIAEYVSEYVDVSDPAKACSGKWQKDGERNESSGGVDLIFTSEGGCPEGAELKIGMILPGPTSEGPQSIGLDISGAVEGGAGKGAVREAHFNVVRLTPGPNDGKGSCKLMPDEMTAGETADLTIECVTGPIEEGGAISVTLPHPVFMSHVKPSVPGITEPERVGEVGVETDSGAGLKISTTLRSYHRSVDITFLGKLPQAAKVRIVLPKVTFTLAGSWPMEIWTDSDGDGSYAPVEPGPPFKVLPGSVDSWALLGPWFETDGKASFKLAPLDGMGNPAAIPDNMPDVSVNGERTELSRSSARHGRGIFLDLELKNKGLNVVEIDISGPGGRKISVPVLRPDKDSLYKTFFGDLHGHSAFSDGTGTPEEYFSFADETAALDFAALTDHQQWLNEAEWKNIVDMAEKHNEPGKFAAITGLELNMAGWPHVNIYFPRRPDIKWPQGAGGNFILMDYNGIIPVLFINNEKEMARVVKETGAIAVYHRAGSGGVLPDVPDSVDMPLFEIYSMHGSAEGFENGMQIVGMKPGDDSFRSLLEKGRRVGVLASSDSHDGMPGMTNGGYLHGGLTAVPAEGLDREKLFDAIRSRRTYATTGNRFPLVFEINGHVMGEEFESGPVLNIEAAGAGNLEIQHFHAGTWEPLSYPYREPFCTVAAKLDLKGRKGLHIFYLRVLGEDSLPIAWSSPIWVNVVSNGGR